MPRPAFLAALLLVLVLPSAGARADTLAATLGQPLREIAHAVDVQLQGGVGTLRVRRSFANSGARHDEASLRIVLPYGAAATGLRIRAGKRWFDGELLEAERAAALYRELTGLGAHVPRDPALLQWVWASEVHLQVFPVPPAGTSTIEYTLTVPTRYVGGRHVLSYPRPVTAPNLVPVVLRVFPESSSSVTVDGQLVAAGQPTILAAPQVPTWQAALRLAPDASHVVSELVVDHPGRVPVVRVAVDIRHTFRGDLRVALVTPSGRQHLLHDRQGGSQKDVRRTYPVTLGAAGEPAAGTWRLLVSDHARLDVGSLERWSLVLVGADRRERRDTALDTPRFIPDAPDGDGTGVATIAVAPPAIATVVARLGRVVAGPGKQFLRLELDAAPQLRPLPRGLQVVFVVDASRSVRAAGLAAQLQVASSFLGHVPDARAEVVLFRRRATRLLERWASGAELEGLLTAARSAGKLELGNGSALEEGLRAAVGALRERGGQGPRMVVLATDALLRSRFKTASALGELARASRETVAHVVLPAVDGGAVDDRRDDAHELAALAAAHGGVLLHVSGLPARDGKALQPVTLGLVRPTRIDGFRVNGLGAAPLPDLPQVLVEGAGCREMVAAAAAPERVVLQGKIWARPFRRVVHVAAPFSRHSAAFVFSHDLHRELSRPEMLRVAFFGRAVSPVTSYLSREPGVRPSTAGINRLVHRGGSGSGAGYGRGVGMLSGRRPPDLQALLQDGLGRCAAAHHPPRGWSASFVVELTYEEIVDVVLHGTRGPHATCLEEELWRVQVPAPVSTERQTLHLALR